MTVSEWIKKTTARLAEAGIASARLDALILLEDATGKDRAWLLAHPDEDIFQGGTLEALYAQVERRTRHEPLAYIRGKSEFYGREFLVTPATLQPRPETETMIDLLKHIYQIEDWGLGIDEPSSILDIGTGSGCIAITAKLEFPELQVLATEINEDALKIAEKNAQKLGANIKFHQGNLLRPIFNLQSPILSPFAILANLPYVPNKHTINKAAMQEPKIAIFGGSDGLDLYREMFSQISSSELRVSLVLTESLPFQHEELTSIANRHGFELTKTDDFIQAFRPKI